MELEAALFVLDSDDDGKVTKEEFIGWWDATHQVPGSAA
jgi:Ca2+-binding EF-hand superfamily protein